MKRPRLQFFLDLEYSRLSLCRRAGAGGERLNDDAGGDIGSEADIDNVHEHRIP